MTFYVWDRMYKYPTGGWVNGTGAPITIPGNSDAAWSAPFGWPTASGVGSQDLLIYRCEQRQRRQHDCGELRGPGLVDGRQRHLRG